MERVNSNIRLHVQIVIFLIIWVLLLYFSGTFDPLDYWAALRRLPLAISIYAILGVIFTRWLWRWPIFQGWLVKMPVLEGTWAGEIKSDWVDPSTNEKTQPVSAKLVIKQTLSDIDCKLLTSESTSYSTTADIKSISNNDDLFLSYTYTNRPTINRQDRSPIHDGAAILKIIKNEHCLLEGEYWTSRKTRGEMSFQFESKKLAQRFS